MDKGVLLDRLGATGEDRMLLAKVWDRMQQARSRNIPAATDFLSPQQQILTRELLHLAGAAETEYVLLGGYPEAERRLVLFLPDWMEMETAESESPIRCLRASFRAEQSLSHRDFLGSLMGMGIVREKIGDILVGPESADILVLETVEPFLLQSWDSAGRVKLNVTSVPLEYLHIPQVQWEEIRDTVSSLRLDAVVSTGLRMSRGKAAELISGGRVQVNWQECTKPDRAVAERDTISARGYGKFQLLEAGGITKKGRICIVVKRFI